MATVNDNKELIKQLAQAVDEDHHSDLVRRAAKAVDDPSLIENTTINTDQYQTSTFSNDVELLTEFYTEVRESFRVAMAAEGIDEDCRKAVLETVDDNV